MEKKEFLTKYETKQNDTPYFITLPKSVFANELTSDALGLYIYLRSISGRNGLYGKILSVPRTTIATLAKGIGWQRQQNKVKSLLGELQTLGLLLVQGLSGSLVDIVFCDDKDANHAFTKLYSKALRQIIINSTGKALLTRLAIYAAFRSAIYENGTDYNVFCRSINYLGVVAKVSYSSVYRHMTWFRDNNILAYFLCRTLMSNGQYGKKFVYADYHDGHLLAKKIQSGHLQNVLIREVLE